MKKIIKSIVVIAILFTLVACNEKSEGLKDGVYTNSAKGNSGEVTVELVMKSGVISEVKVIDHHETPGLGDIAMEQIISLMLANNSTNIDAIAGATLSSNALIDSVNAGLKQAGADEDYLNAQTKVIVEKESLNNNYKYDVVIIGAGGAGLSAAYEAAKSGASVAVLEKTPAVGGNTLVSGGGINAYNTRQQIAMGIEDTAELFYTDTINGGDEQANPVLVEIMTSKSLEAADWLMDEIDVVFMPDRVQQFGGHSVGRALIPQGNKGVEIIDKLMVKLEELNVDVYLETPATSITKTDGLVSGVTAENNGKEIIFEANKGVIVASGGFASNVDMRVASNANYDEKFLSTATSASQGDGITMAQEVNANLIDMEFIQVYPTCNPITGIISYVANSRFDGAILLNLEGNRFVNEMGRRDDISNAILSQTGSVGYLVWGQEIESVGEMTKVHKAEYDSWVDQGLLYKAETIEELASYFKIDSETMIASINEYNLDIEDGSVDGLVKTGALKPIAQGPYYIQKVVPSTHHTMGGIQINENAEVLDINGEVIDRLYAAGEVTGDIHGTNRLGGNAITDIIVFGRIAGQNVVK